MRKGLPFAVLALLSTRPVVAQITGEFTPRLGVFVPTRDLIVTSDPNTGVVTAFKGETKFNIGARIGVWFGPFLGLETVVDYNKSGVMPFAGGQQLSGPIGSHYFAASGRATARLRTRGGGVGLVLSGGAGLVDRGGDFIQGMTPPLTRLTGRTRFAPAGGVGLLIRLSRDVVARLDADAYTYTAEYGIPGAGSLGRRRQYDLFFTFGLSGPFKDYAVPGQ